MVLLMTDAEVISEGSILVPSAFKPSLALGPAYWITAVAVYDCRDEINSYTPRQPTAVTSMMTNHHFFR